MKKLLSLLLLSFSVSGQAQQVEALKQVSLSRWQIGSANYSGITGIGGNRYAVVSDKEPADGFFLFRIDQDPTTGALVSVYLESFQGNRKPVCDSAGVSVRDCEGIAYHPLMNTVFISGEGDQAILEYAMDGQPTGRGLNVPAAYRKIVPNYGFEALTYCPQTRRFWTTTEATLPADGPYAAPTQGGVANVLRLQAFDENLQPVAQYPYRMDAGHSERFGTTYVCGVSAMTALPDGRLLILEREVNVMKNYLGSTTVCKLFLVQPATGWQIDASTDLRRLDGNKFLVKQLLASFKTNLTNFANYEGMCLGRKLADGRQTLLLISDSQGGAGNELLHLKDYVKVLVLPTGF